MSKLICRVYWRDGTCNKAFPLDESTTVQSLLGLAAKKFDYFISNSEHLDSANYKIFEYSDRPSEVLLRELKPTELPLLIQARWAIEEGNYKFLYMAINDSLPQKEPWKPLTKVELFTKAASNESSISSLLANMPTPDEPAISSVPVGDIPPNQLPQERYPGGNFGVQVLPQIQHVQLKSTKPANLRSLPANPPTAPTTSAPQRSVIPPKPQSISTKPTAPPKPKPVSSPPGSSTPVSSPPVVAPPKPKSLTQSPNQTQIPNQPQSPNQNQLSNPNPNPNVNPNVNPTQMTAPSKPNALPQKPPPTSQTEPISAPPAQKSSSFIHFPTNIPLNPQPNPTPTSPLLQTNTTNGTPNASTRPLSPCQKPLPNVTAQLLPEPAIAQSNVTATLPPAQVTIAEPKPAEKKSEFLADDLDNFLDAIQNELNEGLKICSEMADTNEDIETL